MHLKYFSKEGYIYKMKPQYFSNTIIVLGLCAFAYGAYTAKIYSLMWGILIVAVLVIIAFVAKKLNIDTQHREIHAKSGIIKSSVIIPIDSIQNFEVLTLTQGFIRINASLYVYYLDDNKKEKSLLVANGFSVRSMQNILNEIDEIIENERD